MKPSLGNVQGGTERYVTQYLCSEGCYLKVGLVSSTSEANFLKSA